MDEVSNEWNKEKLRKLRAKGKQTIIEMESPRNYEIKEKIFIPYFKKTGLVIAKGNSEEGKIYHLLLK